MSSKVTSQATLYLTADRSTVVAGDGHPSAAFLLVRAGMEIEVSELKKYGLPEDGSIPEFDKETGLVKGKSTDETAPAADDSKAPTDDGKTAETKAGKPAKNAPAN